MAGLCRNGLHEMTRDNLTTESRCRACRNASYRAKRKRIKDDPKARAKRKAASERSVTWSRFNDVSTPRKKIQWAVKIIANDWAESDADFEKLVAGVARAKMRYLPKRADELTSDIVEAARSELAEAVEVAIGMDKKNPFKHLHVKPDAEKAWERFDKALRLAAETGENVPNCQGRSAEFVDYDDDDLPTAEDAYRMCYGCPLIELCANYAEQERPAWGVHAGEVWISGEIVNK